MSQKRTIKRGNYRNVSHLCPNCFSTLSQSQQGEMICTGDRLDKWREEYQRVSQLPSLQMKEFLDQLEDVSRFLELGSSKFGESCGVSSKLNYVAAINSIRIPDPIAVTKLERTLKRSLTEEELNEEFVFQLDGNSYQLPFIQFPEDV